MITQTYNVDMTPSGAPLVVHVSQYDKDARRLVFNLYNGGVAYTPAPGATATIRGTKPDNTVFMYTMEMVGSVASIDLKQQMALVAGDVPAEITVLDSDGTINSANFIIRVEKGAIDENTAISDTDLPIFTELVGQAEDARDAAITAQGNAEIAEAGAVAAQTAAESLIPATGTNGQYLQKTANGTQWATVSEVPTTGTTGQYLQKTANGSQWADVDALPAGGTNGQVLTILNGAAGWDTPAYVPTTGTTDYVLTKTAAGYAWAQPTGGATNLCVTITESGGTYSANKTLAEIDANITNGGMPYAIYSNNVYRLVVHNAGVSATFSVTNANGYIYNFRVDSDGTVTFTISYANTTATVNIGAAAWTNNEYTLSNSIIPAAARGDVYITMPNATTATDLETNIAAFRAADIYAYNQVSGAITLRCLGTVPTSTISITIVAVKRY